MNKRERYRGALLGLAVGDALGTTLEFHSPGTFTPIVNMVGSGPFDLRPGQWTDDTSMALCLAESLITKRCFDPSDQMERYLRWYRHGHLSSTGECFDIGTTTSSSLERFEQTHEPYCGTGNAHHAGNGCIMRLAPVPLFFAEQPEEAIARSGDSSRTTHGNRDCVDACRYLGALIVGAARGATKDELLSNRFCPVSGYWDSYPLSQSIDEIASGSFKTREPPQIKGTGHVVRSLEAALWAFNKGTDFRDGALLSVNLGDDADTTGAIYGQLAGAYYGVDGIPAEWQEKIAKRDLILTFADRLCELAHSS